MNALNATARNPRKPSSPRSRAMNTVNNKEVSPIEWRLMKKYIIALRALDYTYKEIGEAMGRQGGGGLAHHVEHDNHQVKPKRADFIALRAAHTIAKLINGKTHHAAVLMQRITANSADTMRAVEELAATGGSA